MNASLYKFVNKILRGLHLRSLNKTKSIKKEINTLFFKLTPSVEKHIPLTSVRPCKRPALLVQQKPRMN